MNFQDALTAAKAGKTISRPSLPDVNLVWVLAERPPMRAQLVRLFSDGTVVGHHATTEDLAAEDWVAA